MINQFESRDFIGLGGLALGQVVIEQDTSVNVSNMLIRIGNTGELLATLTDVQRNTLTAANFG